MDTSVVNIATGIECDVYIGRGRDGIWGNPFIINRHGNRRDVITKHRPYLIDQFLSGDRTWEQIKGLHGQILGCHCYPQACHGDTLKYFADMAVTFDTEEEFLGFVRKEKGEKDERPPEVRLQHLQIGRSTLEKELENAQQLHRKASSGGAADMRVFDALLQQKTDSLKNCIEEIEALEEEVGVQPAPPQPRKTKPVRPKKRKQEPKQQDSKQQDSKQENPEMSTQTQQAPQMDPEMMEQFQLFLQFQQMQQQNGGQLPATPAAPPPPPLWTYQTTKPTRSGRTYVEVMRGNEVVVHVPSEHWHEGIFHACQLDDIDPPDNNGAGKILLRTEILVDSRYIGRIAATPDQCPTTLQSILDKFGDVPRHQKVTTPEIEGQAEHKHYRFPNPEATAVETVTAEEQEAKQATRTTTPPASNGKAEYDEGMLTDLVKELSDEGLTRPEIKAEIENEHGIAISLNKISQLKNK